MNSPARDARYLVGTPSGDSPIKTTCPNPDHQDSTPSYAVYADGGYCFGCGYRENFSQIVARYKAHPEQLPERGAISTRNAQDRFANLNGSLDVATKVWHRTLMSGPRQERKGWLLERGFTEESLTRFRFGHTGDHFTIPLWEGDRLVGYKLRTDPRYADPNDQKYLNPKGQPATLVRPHPHGHPTVVVEGELDCYLLAQWGVDALTVSTGAGSLPDAIRATAATVYGIPDDDEAGRIAGQAMVETAPDRVHLLRLPWGSDVTDFLCAVEPTARGQALRELFNARPNPVEAGSIG